MEQGSLSPYGGRILEDTKAASAGAKLFQHPTADECTIFKNQVQRWRLLHAPASGRAEHIEHRVAGFPEFVKEPVNQAAGGL
jgi:hypothetical protein